MSFSFGLRFLGSIFKNSSNLVNDESKTSYFLPVWVPFTSFSSVFSYFALYCSLIRYSLFTKFSLAVAQDSLLAYKTAKSIATDLCPFCRFLPPKMGFLSKFWNDWMCLYIILIPGLFMLVFAWLIFFWLQNFICIKKHLFKLIDR